MIFTNMRNVFSIFGNFLVFDEDITPALYASFAGFEIAIKKDNSPKNTAGKVLVIAKQSEGLTLNLFPYRLDIIFESVNRREQESLIDKACDLFKKLDSILENPLGTRIAINMNDFVYDDFSEVIKSLSSSVSFLNPSTISEFNLRTNNPKVINDEKYNVVQTITNAQVSNNNKEGVSTHNSILVTLDINSDGTVRDERFNLSSLKTYYKSMFNEYRSSLDFLATEL